MDIPFFVNRVMSKTVHPFEDISVIDSKCFRSVSGHIHHHRVTRLLPARCFQTVGEVGSISDFVFGHVTEMLSRSPRHGYESF